ncbi:hypothetical protein OS493_036620 [Desmophyllum pertusum]|uniref:non-specific serine/threonine protein kinase n=1 Tax=Desmophyllum pertusum TaxID=174260 RepID=A0A9W9ZIB0_9CNID|nr:hypothetical protein OS493_036620 [Desmophyllum pertusum]
MGSDSVVLTENFTAKICNFEYAQRVQYDDSSGIPISHLEYLYDWMAPEQLSGKPADQPGDAFSFGILVWECVTRKRPLKYVKSLRQLTKATVDPRVQKIPANWSQTFKILIGDCLKDAPIGRIFNRFTAGYLPL